MFMLSNIYFEIDFKNLYKTVFCHQIKRTTCDLKYVLISLISTSSIQSNLEHLTYKPGLFIKRFVLSKLVVGFGEQDLCPWNSNIVYAWLSNYQMARAPVLYTVAYLRTRILQLGNGELSAVREHFWNDGKSYKKILFWVWFYYVFMRQK